LLATIASSQIIFERQQYSAADYSSVFAAADLNNDGATDLIVAQLIGLGNNDGFVVYLSNGDGTFQPPVPYAVPNTGPSPSIVTADFNNDGKADVVSADGGGFFVYLGNGDGTLRPPTHFQLPSTPLLAAADVNHDGKVDLVLLYGTGVSIMYEMATARFRIRFLFIRLRHRPRVWWLAISMVTVTSTPKSTAGIRRETRSQLPRW
jgi:hypothetical protein